MTPHKPQNKNSASALYFCCVLFGLLLRVHGSASCAVSSRFLESLGSGGEYGGNQFLQANQAVSRWVSFKNGGIWRLKARFVAAPNLLGGGDADDGVERCR